jgi:sugar phosphate isomerase/epimerase
MASYHSRRTFLRSAVVASLAAASSDGRAAVAPPRRVGGSSIKLALNAYSFSKLLNDAKRGNSDLSLVGLVDYCAVQGFDGFDPTGYFFPGYPDAPSTAFVHELKRRAFDLGIGISGTGIRNNFTTADKSIRAAGVEHIKMWVETAARLGAPVVRVFADTQMKSQTWQTVAPGRSRDEVESWIADDLRVCAEQGEKYGVIIGVQNHGDFLQTAEEHLSLIRRVDSPWCGPIVDTGYYKTDDPYRDIAAVAPYAVNWQVKESPIAAGSDVRTDLKKLLTIVRMSGYRGYLPIETLSASGQDYDPYEVVPRFLAELRTAVTATASIRPAIVEAPPQERAAPTVSTVPAPKVRTRKPANKKKST